MALPIRLHDEPPSHLITLYCVQTYWDARSKLAVGVLKECVTEEKALALGRRLARRHTGVVVFAVTGNPEADYWAEPLILAAHGRTPLCSRDV